MKRAARPAAPRAPLAMAIVPAAESLVASDEGAELEDEPLPSPEPLPLPLSLSLPLPSPLPLSSPSSLLSEPPVLEAEAELDLEAVELYGNVSR